jgi:hypothetical protein
METTCVARLVERTSMPRPLGKQDKDSIPGRDAHFRHENYVPDLWRAAIPNIKMEVRFLARYNCPSGHAVLIEGDKPQA